jgi:transposase
MEQTLKQMNREERGRFIYKNSEIVQTPHGWKVPSQEGNAYYLVKYDKHNPKCTCPDCQLRKQKCKHIYAVEFFIKERIDKEGQRVTTRGIKVSYAQEWKAYDKAQTNEKIVFMKLLKDLCSNLIQPTYKFGRPSLNTAEMVFNSVMKVYSTFSLRRFMSDMKIAKEIGIIENVPCYASIGHFMQKGELNATLKYLIQLSALPLKEIEKDFAVDSSGFSTSRFGRWFDYKYGKETKQRIWLKAHICTGVKTNIITSVEVTEGRGADSPQLKSLLEETSENFKLQEVSCDRAYSSRANLEFIEGLGAMPYIPFKSNTTGRAGGSRIWRRMYHYFLYKNEEFLEFYHKRSNVETCFHMIKTKFKDNLRSKGKLAQTNELLCKILAHNICVVIQEISELGIKGEFIVEEKK